MVNVNRSQFYQVGKALEAAASTLGLGEQPAAWPRILTMTGLGVGEMLFYEERTTTKWRTYASMGGRVIRVVTAKYQEEQRTKPRPPRNPS